MDTYPRLKLAYPDEIGLNIPYALQGAKGDQESEKKSEIRRQATPEQVVKKRIGFLKQLK